MAVTTQQPQSLRHRANATNRQIHPVSVCEHCDCEDPDSHFHLGSPPPPPSLPRAAHPSSPREDDEDSDEYPPWADPEIVARKRAAKRASRRRVGKSRGKYIPKWALKKPKKIRLKVPESAKWGFSNFPYLVKILFLASFLGILSATVPYWAGLSSVDGWEYMHFGLWHLCIDKDCTSIHDNVIPGKQVPAWWSFVQGTHCIGVVGALVSMGFASHNMNGSKIVMAPTTYMTALAILGISIFQQFISLFTLLMYIEETDFLYIKDYHNFDFHWAFYCAMACLFLTCAAAVFLLFDEDAIRGTHPKPKPEEQPPEYQPLLNDAAYAEVYDQYYFPENYLPQDWSANGNQIPTEEQMKYFSQAQAEGFYHDQIPPDYFPNAEGFQNGVENGVQYGVQNGVQTGVQNGFQNGFQDGVPNEFQNGVQNGYQSQYPPDYVSPEEGDQYHPDYFQGYANGAYEYEKMEKD